MILFQRFLAGLVSYVIQLKFFVACKEQILIFFLLHLTEIRLVQQLPFRKQWFFRDWTLSQVPHVHRASTSFFEDYKAPLSYLRGPSFSGADVKKFTVKCKELETFMQLFSLPWPMWKCVIVTHPVGRCSTREGVKKQKQASVLLVCS